MKTLKGRHNIFYGYKVVSAAVLILTIVWGTNRTFGIFLKPMLAEFGWSRASISGAFTLAMIVMGLASIVTGRITDRFGPRPVVICCGIFLGAGYLLAAMIHSRGNEFARAVGGRLQRFFLLPRKECHPAR